MPIYILDTNVWLERLLGQTRADEVGRFLSAVPTCDLAITDFSFHSIALIMSRLGRFKDFLRFSKDLFSDGGVAVIRLSPDDMDVVDGAMTRYKLDFDDAYQYVAAGRPGTTFVSYDSDFDKTDLKRLTPSQAV